MLFFIIAALIVLYITPTIVAIMRVHDNIVAIVVLNLFLGWTLLFWVIALVWALYESSPRVDFSKPPERLSPDALKLMQESAKIAPEPIPHCMAHDLYWPACYTCNLRLHGLHDEPDQERRS